MQIFLLLRLITLTLFTLFQLSAGIIAGLVVFTKVLVHLIPLLVLCLIHSNSCPHLLDWPIKEFDWFPLPSPKSKSNLASSTNSNSTPSMVEAQFRAHTKNMSSISQLPLTLSAAPPGRQQQQQPQPIIKTTNAFSSPSFAHSRTLSTTLSPTLSKPPPALNLHSKPDSRQRSLAGMSFFLQSPESPPQPPAQTPFKSARERREEQDLERERRKREQKERSMLRTRELVGPRVDRLPRTGSAGSDETGNAGVRMFDPENRRRFYGEAGWSNDV